MNRLINYYNEYDEEGRLTTNNARKVELLTTTRVLDEIIPSNSKIIDVAAGTGVYAFHYASKGHKVFAGDIVPKHVNIMNRKLEEHSCKEELNIETGVLNAIDLSQFKDNSFDVVLCMGPIYHLLTEVDRKKCISECLRVLNKGGLLVVAYINKHFIMPMLMKGNDELLNSELVDKIVIDGIIRDGDKDCFWTDAYFTSPREVEEMMEQFDIQEVEHIGTDGISPLLREYVDNLSEDEFKIWLEYHIQNCKEKSILGMSNHGLYICRKI
ncbi:class I SAM-dependent methyltransferase [Vallitalea sp.]|jgi:ubiquinone/menaquinone biosynthesis C-methylase UbiE|uniref:class I SAM-dependent methyltransferase n=1 Tax=Vallitalea sp. TaxID=1882829 RepID=UPI0025CFF8E7|nr:class I SAM-dependent methyltransferase [Vallitalea sp.]MCT4686653.1 class I SAM-dependent methyltransferase [Vallitalea sp.]